MDEIISLQKRHMYFCAAAAACAVWFFVLAALGLRRLYPGAYTAGALPSALLFAYGLPGFFKFRKRAQIATIVSAGLLAQWWYDETTWSTWLAGNRKYSKVDLWNGKGFLVAYLLGFPILFGGFYEGPIGTLISVLLIAVAVCILPILNGVIYLRQRRRPEVFLSAYGAFVGTSLLRFFNRRDGSLISQATIVPDESYPCLEVQLTQSGTGSSRSPFSGRHTTTRRILIPYDSVAEAEALLGQLTARYAYDTAMAQLPSAES
jgi:FtsH-binding integral membrane protein